MSNPDYWQEAIEEAAKEVGATLTEEQASAIAGAVSISHDNYGLAYYSPPSSDIYDRQDREWQKKYDDLRAEFDRYIGNAEEAVRRKFKVHREDGVSIGDHGEVFAHGGRTRQIQ